MLYDTYDTPSERWHHPLISIYHFLYSTGAVETISLLSTSLNCTYALPRTTSPLPPLLWVT